MRLNVIPVLQRSPCLVRLCNRLLQLVCLPVCLDHTPMHKQMREDFYYWNLHSIMTYRTNTLGPHKPSRRWTWHSPNGKTHNQIDYCITPIFRVEESFAIFANFDFARNFPPAKIISTANGISRNFPPAKFSSREIFLPAKIKL